MYIRGMEEHNVTSLQNLIRAATEGGLQGLYGGLLSTLKMSSSSVQVHAQSEPM